MRYVKIGSFFALKNFAFRLHLQIVLQTLT